MAVPLPLVVDPNQDPYLLNLKTIDPSLQQQPTDQSTPSVAADTAISGGAPISTQATLSGDSYIPPETQPTQPGPTGLPYLPPAGPTPNLTDPSSQAPSVAPGYRPPRVGENFADYVASQRALRIPQPAPPGQTGPPPATFGDDFAGSILSQEQNLPDWARAGVHGAQAGVGPLAGMIAGAEAGAYIGTFFDPITLGFGTVIGGILGGIGGAYLASQAQDRIGNALVPKQTTDALNAQTAWDQQNQGGAYAIGSLIPQALAFRPSPTAVAEAFKLAGRMAVTRGVAEKLAVFQAGSRDAQNQLQMLAMGPGMTYAQNFDAINQGKVAPNVLAIQLVGSVILSKPTKWLQFVAPSFRDPIIKGLEQSRAVFSKDAGEQLLAMAGDNPELQAKARTFMSQLSTHNDLLRDGKDTQAAAMMPGMQQLIDEINQAHAAPESPTEGTPPQEPPTPGTPPETPPGAPPGVEPPVAPAQGSPPAPADAIPPVVASRPAGFRPGDKVNYGDGVVDVVSTLDDGQIEVRTQNGDIEEVNPEDLGDRVPAATPTTSRPPQSEGAPIDPDIEPIRATQARGNSRPMSMDGIQRLGAQGKALLEVYKHNTAPTTGLDANWDALKEEMWDKTRTSWGGLTIDSHTGVPITSLEDKYAVGAPEKTPGEKVPAGTPGAEHRTISIPIDSSKEDFMKAADQAKAKFAPQLKRQGYNLGVFHDAEKGKIEFDPSIVVNSRHEAEAIGVYTHQRGGAYHFASGNGHFMPHLSEALTPKPMELVHYSGASHTVLDPAFQGTGAPSAELAKNGPHFNVEDRMLSAYKKGTRPEKFFGKGTPAPVEHVIKNNFKILKVGSPEWNTLKRQTVEANNGIEDRQKLDTAIHQAGYDGYTRNGTVKLFGKQPVSEINGMPVEHPEEGIEHAPDGSLKYKIESGNTPAKKGISTIEEKGRVRVFVDGELAGVAQQGQEGDRPEHWTNVKEGSRGMSTLDKSKMISKIAEQFITDKAHKDAMKASAEQVNHGMVTRRSMADPITLTKALKASGYKVSKTIDNPPDHGLILPNGLGVSFQNRYVTTHSGEFAELFGLDPGPEGKWGAGRDGSDVGAIFVSGDYASVGKLDAKASDTLTDWVLGLMKKNASFRSTHPRYGPPDTVKISVSEPYGEVVIPISALKENGFDFVKAAKEYGRKAPMQYRRQSTPDEVDSWPQLRQAILEQGGIGPSKDWPRDWIPGDLYRINGKAPDLVAAETTIGRADLPPWGVADDTAMFSHLRDAFAQHQARGLKSHQEIQTQEHGESPAPLSRQELNKLSRTELLSELNRRSAVNVDRSKMTKFDLIESVIKGEKRNGLQQEAARQPETGSEASGGSEASLGSQASRSGQVGGEESTGSTTGNEVGNASENSLNGAAQRTTTNDGVNSGEGQFGGEEPSPLHPSNVGAGDIRANAGDAARIAGSTIHAPSALDASGRPLRTANGDEQTVTPNFTPERYIARNSEANQWGTSISAQPSQGRASRWTSSSDVADFPQKVAEVAPQFGVDLSDPELPQIMHEVRLLPEQHQENLAYMNKSNSGTEALNRANLAIPDDPAFIPRATGDITKWKSLKLADRLAALVRAHPNGDPNLESLPIKITNDAARVALTLRGWRKRFFYDNARAFPNSIPFENSADRQVWQMAQSVFGDKMSVLMDARATISFFSMYKAGVFKNLKTGAQFDHDIFQSFLDAGIVKNFSATGVSRDNLVRASLGLRPESQKIGDFFGAAIGEARAPVDMWRARLAFGIDNTPNTKLYDYEFGRNNFLTRLFPSTHPGPDAKPNGKDGPPPIPFMPYHQQSAEWYGYQEYVSERAMAIKEAARATGDPALIALANKLKSNLVSKDLAEVFRDRYGLTPGTKPHILPFHELLARNDGRVGKQLVELSKPFMTMRYLKGKLGRGKSDLLDIQEKATAGALGSVLRTLDYAPEVRKDLADYYKKYFVDAKTIRAGSAAAQQSLDRNVGHIALRLMEAAYAREYPREFREEETAARELAGIARTPTDIPYSREAMLATKATYPEMQEKADQALTESLNQMNLPQGMVSNRLYYGEKGDGIAHYDYTRPNEISINSRYFSWLNIIREDVARLLVRELRGAKDFSPAALKKVTGVAAQYKADGAWVYKRVIGHELAHAIQHRILGSAYVSHYNLLDEEVLPAAHALLEIMTPKYMIGLVREGLGNELAALLKAHSTSLNEYVGEVKYKKAPDLNDLSAETMPLRDAVDNLLEHQADQWGVYHGTNDYSRATPETFRRNVHEPEIAEANARELGRIYEEALKVLDDPLAVEAETQLSGRGPNAAIDPRLLEPEEASADKAAYSKLTEADALHPDPGGWADTAAPNQGLAQQLTSGERALTIKSAADGLRNRMATPDYKPENGDHELLAVLDAQVAALNKPPTTANQWRINDPRLPSAELPYLQKATAQAAIRVTRLPDEGDRAFALRVVRASGAYDNLDHALTVANAARNGAWVPVKFGDKVGFRIGTRFYKDSPLDHVSNWDSKFHGVIHSVLDNVPDHALVGEATPTSPVPGGDMGQLRMAFADEYKAPAPNARVGAATITSKTGEALPIPSMKPNDFRRSGRLIPTAKLIENGASSGNAANMLKAHFEHIQESLDFGQSLADRGIFDPQAVVAENERLAAEGGGVPPPRGPSEPPPPGGEEPIGGGGKKPKGQSPEEKQVAEQKARVLNSGKTLSGYLGAFGDSLQIQNASHRAVTASIHDIAVEMAKTFDTREWYKDSRNWIRDASGKIHSLAMAYQRTGVAIDNRIKELNAISPGANDRIRAVIHASSDEARDGLLAGMSDEEKALANHLYHYWRLTGDVLLRAGVIKTALENYFPLMIESSGGRPGFKSSAKSVHAIGRLRDEDGNLLNQSPEDLQAWADDKGLDWKVRTDVGGIFQAHGNSVSQSLAMKHAVDQLSKNFEAQIGQRPGETAPPILSNKRMDENIIASEHKNQYVRSSDVRGAWKSALSHRAFPGATPEDTWIHKPLAEMMGRETGFVKRSAFDENVPKELLPGTPENLVTNVARTIGTMNGLFKQYKFFFTPVHGFSMLGNILSHTGFNPLQVGGILKGGHDIVNGPNAQRYRELLRAGGMDEPGDVGGAAALVQRAPVVGPLFKRYHELIWRDINYEGTFGLADKLSKEYLAGWPSKHPDEPITPDIRSDADKWGMAQAKKALGNLDTLDMSRDWALWGNVAFLANKWTTSQLRTLGEAFSIGPLKDMASPFARLGGVVPLEGSSPAATAYMQQRAINASQHLVFGGLLRLAITGTVMSTAISAIHNNGVPTTPFQNYQKDPARMFDIYTGRDATTNRDTWIHMPFFLFQREMLDWVMSAVKANSEGKDFIDSTNLGDSVLAQPFLKFVNKMDPVTKTALEGITGSEISSWMSGYNDPRIDHDKNITNLNQSLQLLGMPNGGSLENRLLYAWRNLFPGFGFPTDMKAVSADPSAVAGALGLGLQNSGQLTGFRNDQGTQYEVGPGGKEIPVWEAVKNSNEKKAIGQEIAKIAVTLGTGTPAEEKAKLQQMEALRQQGNFTPGQLTNILLYRASHQDSTDQPGLIGLNAAPDTSTRATQVNGTTLTPQQEVAYQSVTFQGQAAAMEQALSDPSWKTMDWSEQQKTMTNLKAFADRITNERFAIALGTKTGPLLSSTQATQMIGDFGILKKQTQNALLTSSIFKAANPADQAIMQSDRIAASENAVWEKYYGTTNKMKGASDALLASYVALQGGLRDEVRTLIEKLPSFSTSLDPAAQAQELQLSLTFADSLVNQALQGKAPRIFDSPLTQTQLVLAVRNGVVLQDAALKELHRSFIYQEAPQVDQLLLDSKYVTLAHNVALFDTQRGVQEGTNGYDPSFNAILSTTLKADEGYQTLIEQFFGTGGRVVLAQREAELADLKARFKQEYNVAPADLTRYDTMINRWYEQQNPDYANFLYYRKQWEKYDPLGQAYRATIQSNLGFESSNPLALPVA